VILLDTHVALWLAMGSGTLGKRTRRIARQAAAANELAISALSFWEIALLIAKRRLRPPETAQEMRRRIMSEGAIELPLTGEIAVLAGELEGLHGDPADRFIVATAIAHDAMLVTADDRLLQWRHGLRRHNAET
jgi:PIN domain nuclease of toxin-antitoxin system